MKNEDKKVRQLFIDMAGVLADFENGLSEVLGHKVRLSDIKDVYSDRKREVTSKHLFRRLKPLPDAWKLVDWALNSGIHTEILTAAGTINRTIVIKDKIDWIKEYCTDHWIIIPTFKGSQKAAFAHSKAVLIDDRPKNIECWEAAGGIGILHTTADETIAQLNELVKEK